MSHIINAFLITIRNRLRVLALLTLAASYAFAAPVPIADNPMFITVNIAPNILVTLDDSGSMGRAYVPDLCGNPDQPNCGVGVLGSVSVYPGGLDNRYVKSAYFNPLYYDPNTTYPAAKNAAGNELPPCSDTSSTTNCFRNVYLNGFDPTRGTVNMETGYRPTAGYSPPATTADAELGVVNAGAFPSDYYRFMNHYTGDFATRTSFVGAYYYVFVSTNAGCNAADNRDNDCYTLKMVNAASGPGGVDERMNFAKWYAFYRTRNLMTVTAATRAFADIDDETRVAWQALGSCTSYGVACQGWDNVNRENRIRKLLNNRSDFYAWLFKLPTPPPRGTALRTAVQRAGEYLKTSGVSSPYAQNPQVAVGTEYGCRKNFHIVMTDGRWNDADAAINVLGAAPNKDNVGATLPDGTVYVAGAPYRDTNSKSMADIAFYYWATDLRSATVGAPALNDNIAAYIVDRSGTAPEQYWNARNDPATWQHMVNYFVGLGVRGYLPTSGLTWGGDTYSGSYPGLKAGTTSWPATAANNDGNIADLWHAAINSRGQFFSAENPTAIADAFKQIINGILEANPSSAALSANSTSIQTGTLIYQAKFDTRDWAGSLLALPVQGDGSIGTTQWDASALIPIHTARNIFTWNGSSGQAFLNCTTNLNASQKTALDTRHDGFIDNYCSERMSWLRGDSSKEARQAGGIFRNRRSTVLGDIINSDPAYTFTDDFGYTGLPTGTPGQDTYSAFVNGKSSLRPPMVYVGANDGMLHAIRADNGNADSGKELFAFIPAGVYDNLSKLTNPLYSHKYYVDGAPSVHDAFWGGTWKTALVGGLNAGGKSIYALDITDPNNFGATKVLWEYTETDLGLTYSQPQIALLNNGQWAAIFGNGYNSPSEHAYLYIVNLETGVLIKKISAGTICGTPPCSNGLSTPILLDTNNDKIVDAVYAGDLQGNLWKFDLSSTDANSWGTAYSGQPVFTARNGSGGIQPITAQPKISGHPNGGYMVFFGTGRYLTNTPAGSSDLNDTSVQAFYGIRDNGTIIATTDRSELQAQTLIDQGAFSGSTVRTSTQNAVDWATKKGWYLDFLNPPSPGTAVGERVVSTPLVLGDRIIFVTLIPNTDPCTPGGDSWVMQVSALTGGAPASSVFDFNNDDAFNDVDRYNLNVVSGIKSTVGIGKTPVVLTKDTSTGYLEMAGSTGDVMKVKTSLPLDPGLPSGSTSRVYWMQIQ